MKFCEITSSCVSVRAKHCLLAVLLELSGDDVVSSVCHLLPCKPIGVIDFRHYRSNWRTHCNAVYKLCGLECGQRFLQDQWNGTADHKQRGGE